MKNLLIRPESLASLAKAIRAERDRRDTSKRLEARERCKSLHQFVKEAWHILEPGTDFIDNWHIEAICLHLEAMTHGKFLELGQPNRLLINVPPGTMKSLIVSVFWPAWEWGPQKLAHLRYLTTSYSQTLVGRDSRRMRDLVLSDWFQELWPHVKLTKFGEKSFDNDMNGSRLGLPFRSLTSQRGDRLLIDDPHSTETAESDAERERAIRIFRESVPSRVNDPDKSPIVIVMQRLHEDDVSGQIEQLGLEYVHLMLPMFFDPERACETIIGWKDPRPERDELLFPSRFTAESIDRDKMAMTSYAIASQWQQLPAPRAGRMIKREWFADKIIDAVPNCLFWVRHWDLAATSTDENATGARTAGVKIGITPSRDYVIADARADRLSGGAVREWIKTTAEADGRHVEISLPQDPGQAGKDQAQGYVKFLAGFNARVKPETGSKEVRAEPFAAQCEVGNVYIVKGAWNDDYLTEICAFPSGLKDYMDATSGAFSRLVAKTPQSNVLVGQYSLAG